MTRRSIDPNVAHLRAMVAAGVRHGHPNVDELRRQLEVARIEAMIRDVVAAAGPLTPDEAASIRAALVTPVRRTPRRRVA